MADARIPPACRRDRPPTLARGPAPLRPAPLRLAGLLGRPPRGRPGHPERTERPGARRAQAGAAALRRVRQGRERHGRPRDPPGVAGPRAGPRGRVTGPGHGPAAARPRGRGRRCRQDSGPSSRGRRVLSRPRARSAGGTPQRRSPRPLLGAVFPSPPGFDAAVKGRRAAGRAPVPSGAPSMRAAAGLRRRLFGAGAGVAGWRSGGRCRSPATLGGAVPGVRRARGDGPGRRALPGSGGASWDGCRKPATLWAAGSAAAVAAPNFFPPFVTFNVLFEGNFDHYYGRIRSCRLTGGRHALIACANRASLQRARAIRRIRSPRASPWQYALSMSRYAAC